MRQVLAVIFRSLLLCPCKLFSPSIELLLYRCCWIFTKFVHCVLFTLDVFYTWNADSVIYQSQYKWLPPSVHQEYIWHKSDCLNLCIVLQHLQCFHFHFLLRLMIPLHFKLAAKAQPAPSFREDKFPWRWQNNERSCQTHSEMEMLAHPKHGQLLLSLKIYFTISRWPAIQKDIRSTPGPITYQSVSRQETKVRIAPKCPSHSVPVPRLDKWTWNHPNQYVEQCYLLWQPLHR